MSFVCQAEHPPNAIARLFAGVSCSFLVLSIAGFEVLGYFTKSAFITVCGIYGPILAVVGQCASLCSANSVCLWCPAALMRCWPLDVRECVCVPACAHRTSIHLPHPISFCLLDVSSHCEFVWCACSDVHVHAVVHSRLLLEQLENDAAEAVCQSHFQFQC